VTPPPRAPARLPLSSYRVQLGPGFRFDDAARLVPYLDDLGITELYCSPILAARPGSPHGYDVCDHNRVSPELGGEEGFAALAAAVREAGMGLVVDFVPNHMSTDSTANGWWRSVLENGPSSPVASYFDIDWDPVKPELKGRLLLPILGDQYGVTLEAGRLRLTLADGNLDLRYDGRDLPLNPRQLRLVLGHDLASLEAVLPAEHPDLTEYQSILFHLEHLPVYTSTDPASIAERRREKDVALGRLASLLARASEVRVHLERIIDTVNGSPGDPASFDLLHRLLEAQPYRLASWRTAMHEINYRRFFDVNELAGIRQEEPAVFEATHALLTKLVAEGSVTGIRLDHVDGLFEPGAYLRRLAARLATAGPVWTLVEKILSEGEQLNPEWPVHGTTGYEFLNQVTRLFVNPAGLDAVQRFYGRFTGQELSFGEVGYRSKKTIVATSMAAELNVLAAALNRISESDRRYRDFTLDSLQEALEEVVASFPVYRTYVRPDGWSPTDAAMVDQVIAQALARNPAMEPTIFSFIRAMLLPSPEEAGDRADLERRVRFAMKFQQYTAPVQAKGIEDTAFYRMAPLASLNEVGGDPLLPSDPVAAFHAANHHRSCHWPLTLLASATHDTKWSEDARARISVLSEAHRRWQAMVTLWHRLNREARTELAGRTAPDPADEYRYYQALVAVWPPEGRPAQTGDLVERMQGYMRKAMREAKVHTSWINPAHDYESAVERFVRETLAGPGAPRFLRSLLPFARRVAWLGMLNSISQLVLKLVSPGVPDLYQGTELWDLSLVDPDNRRDVDFGARAARLANLRPLLDTGASPAESLAGMLRRWTDGDIKLFITAVGLRFRRGRPDLVLEGDYRPIIAQGPAAARLVALARRRGSQALLAVVPRLITGLTDWDHGERPPVGPVWEGTDLVLPRDLAGITWRNLFTGRAVAAQRDRLPASTALADFPWGLFAGTDEGPEFSAPEAP
jgi:(1->4)-alpha-D-glucan 1-alpha-D-glucosylmutase